MPAAVRLDAPAHANPFVSGDDRSRCIKARRRDTGPCGERGLSPWLRYRRVPARPLSVLVKRSVDARPGTGIPRTLRPALMPTRWTTTSCATRGPGSTAPRSGRGPHRSAPHRDSSVARKRAHLQLHPPGTHPLLAIDTASGSEGAEGGPHLRRGSRPARDLHELAAAQTRRRGLRGGDGAVEVGAPRGRSTGLAGGERLPHGRGEFRPVPAGPRAAHDLRVGPVPGRSGAGDRRGALVPSRSSKYTPTT